MNILSPDMNRPYAEARKKLGCSHPAEQLLKVLERVEKLEAVVSDMINQKEEPISEPASIPVPKKKRGRPRKVEKTVKG